jgi:hypothetical protein
MYPYANEFQIRSTADRVDGDRPDAPGGPNLGTQDTHGGSPYWS